ncbi:hypothetical protein [Streptomyces sp. NPDC004675]|uniref:hypothetical protein n=1 Tax=Streptomyces sp. NPDC004675 TaxID=3154286 RepID=UPI0033A52CFB
MSRWPEPWLLITRTRTRTRTRVLNAGRYTGDLAVLRPDWNTGAPRPAGET